VARHHSQKKKVAEGGKNLWKAFRIFDKCSHRSFMAFSSAGEQDQSRVTSKYMTEPCHEASFFSSIYVSQTIERD
jgi:hypothetical protein